MKTDDAQATVLVVGGTGTTGRRVAARLTDLGIPVRIGTRSAHPRFDWDDPDTWAPALEGVAAAYLTYAPDLGLPEAAGRIGRFAELARGRGVRRLVLLAGRGQHGHAPAERALQESDLEWTVARSAWFAQNFSEGFLADQVATGTVAAPAGDAVEAFIDAGDLADVVVAALTEDGHSGRIYELTGPRLLGFADAAAEISRARGDEVTYLPMTDAEFTEALAADGTPAALTGALREVFAELRSGDNASTTGDVERVLGRPPRDFAAFAAAAAADGAWSAAAIPS
ncbi:NmrA family transcriptional regulator [Actinomycetes bacterium KLBMP 9759]